MMKYDLQAIILPSVVCNVLMNNIKPWHNEKRRYSHLYYSSFFFVWIFFKRNTNMIDMNIFLHFIEIGVLKSLT